jgi:hypothetical protein
VTFDLHFTLVGNSSAFCCSFAFGWGSVMKVQLCETVSVDVETTVDVDVNEVLMEFSRRFEEAELNKDLPMKFAYLPMLDFATKLLARIPSAAIGHCSDAARAEMVKRLDAESERWATIYVSAE